MATAGSVDRGGGPVFLTVAQLWLRAAFQVNYFWHAGATDPALADFESHIAVDTDTSRACCRWNAMSQSGAFGNDWPYSINGRKLLSVAELHGVQRL
ncbi:MAG: hypothetical protein ABL904_12725 [Hyphomicrobiaceae bacterium]